MVFVGLKCGSVERLDVVGCFWKKIEWNDLILMAKSDEFVGEMRAVAVEEEEAFLL